MRTYAELLVQRLRETRVERAINKIQAAISRKLDVYHFFDLLIDSVDASDLLVPGHSWPSLVQLNTSSMFHDNIFTTNGI
jgi:hypothetical protein